MFINHKISLGVGGHTGYKQTPCIEPKFKFHNFPFKDTKIEHVAAGNNMHAKPDIWDLHLLFAPRWSFGEVVVTKKAPVSSDIISN